MLLQSHSSLKKKKCLLASSEQLRVQEEGGLRNRLSLLLSHSDKVGMLLLLVVQLHGLTYHPTYLTVHPLSQGLGVGLGREVDRYQPEALAYLASEFSSQQQQSEKQGSHLREADFVEGRKNTWVLVGQTSDGNSGSHKAGKTQDLM